MKYKIGKQEVEVMSIEGFCVMSQSDFDKVATKKVKGPKFKVGDAAYVIVEGCFGISIEKVIIRNKKRIDEGWLCVDYSDCRHIHIKALFTLEEAIEKLKEL